MQDRIKQMAEEAGASQLHRHEFAIFGDAAIERFAQAVARKCEAICLNRITGLAGCEEIDHEARDCAADIRARFGLGE